MSLATRLILCICLVASAMPVDAATPVPAGNRHEAQPDVPGASAKRTRESNSTFERKYRKVLALLQNDPDLRSKIKKIAGDYGIDPLHMAGAIVGEHTYNVDAYDRLQSYYVKAVAYLQSDFGFSFGGETVEDFVERPQFERCSEHSRSYDLWSCRELVWDTEFRGRSVEGVSFPDDRFSAVFFQPFYAGQTFGIGQLNPLTALQMTDLVARVSGFPKLEPGDAQEVYRTIMDPDRTLAYMAATLKTAIDAYGEIAGFDISRNPGITATLYNVGNPEQRARVLKAENEKRRKNGQKPRLPEENYYGWLVNDRIEDLEALF